MSNSHVRIALLLSVFFCSARSKADEPPQVVELRTQEIGETTYFHVRLKAPADLEFPPLETGPYNEWQRRRLALVPQLVPQDGAGSAVYPCVNLVHVRPDVGFKERSHPPKAKGLEFAGKVHAIGRARLLLLYPARESAGDQEAADVAVLLRSPRWIEVAVDLDFSKADVVRKKDDSRDSAGDLERVWAQAQASRLAVLEALAPEFGFYGFACAATGRKYNVRDVVLEGERVKDRDKIHKQMFELTTGSTAITQSLALDRVARPDFRDTGRRSIPIASVQGIDIAEHPWKWMMGDKKPASEPLAKLVPHDNYYITFKSFGKFLEFGDLLDQWGTNAARVYEVNSRDLHLKERYERQLCLQSTWLGRTLGPLLIRGVAVTGSDPYVREGSDISVLFHVKNRAAFLAGVEQFLTAARKQHGQELKETKEDYRGIAVERFVTPLREVSLHRASFDEFVIYSNSPAGLRRILDTFRGDHPSLGDALDFQYMRTVFDRNDAQEDGFAFLSDAFIRQVVGPASKIKEKRRLEALTSLSMLTHGAMFAAWETGRLPADHEALLKAAALKPEYLVCPEGKAMRWDAAKQIAVSDAYNTLSFATPLIELPIDKITPTEQQGYADFRAEYIRLWRQFFDPVGIRLALNKQQVKIDVFILPLVNSEHYRNLRSLTGTGLTYLQPAKLSPMSLAQVSMNLNVWDIGGGAGWGMARLDDGKSFDGFVKWCVRQDVLRQDPKQDIRETLGEIAKLPLTAGIALNAGRDELRDLVVRNLSQSKSHSHKGVTITETNYPISEVALQNIYHADIQGGFYVSLNKTTLHDLIDRGPALQSAKPHSMVEYYRLADHAFKEKKPLVVYVGVHRPELEKDLANCLQIRVDSFPEVQGRGIVGGVPDDRWLTRHDFPADCRFGDISRVLARPADAKAARRTLEKPAKDLVPINFSIHVAPRAAVKARDALHYYLEWEVHKRALPNNTLWYALYRCGLIDDKTPESAKRAAAMKFLGFTPVSPDDAAYVYNRRTAEVVNARHSSLRSPRFQGKLADASPLARMLDQFPALRADMRFREDGLHAVLTIERKTE